MMRWLLSVVAILLIGASSSFNVNYDVADNLLDSQDPSGSQEYEPETEVPEMETEEPNVEEPTGGEDYYDDYFAVKAEEEAAANNADDGEEEEYPDATSESVADGFEDYVDKFEEEAEVADEFEENTGDLENEAENQGNATVVDSVPSFEEGDYGAAESNATDESVADGFEDYVDNLEDQAEVADEFEEYIDDLDSEADPQPEPQVDNSDFIPFENSDGDRNGTAAPSTPNMQEEVGITEDNNITSTSATVVELMPEDAVLATDESVKVEDGLPIDDELVKELEELHDIPDEKELVDEYINYNEGTLDEFENSMNHDSSDVISDSQSEIPEGLQPSVQETTQNEDTDIETVDSTLYDTGNDTVAHSSFDTISDIAEPEPDHDSYDSEQVAADQEPYIPDRDSYDSEQVAVDQESWDSEVVDPSYIPLDTDTQDEADGHGEASYNEDYNRESVYYPDEDIPVASDHSTGVQDSENDEGSYLDADGAQEYPSHESPSEYGSGSFTTDGPAYEHVDLVEEETIEVEVDIPGHISQGDFYDTEYNNFIEESKFSFDDSLSSYHTITYFLFIVLLSVIVYVVYTNKHRFFKRGNNYAYSRLGEQHQPLV